MRTGGEPRKTASNPTEQIISDGTPLARRTGTSLPPDEKFRSQGLPSARSCGGPRDSFRGMHGRNARWGICFYPSDGR